MTACRSCGASVVWVETEARADKPGRKMPLDADRTDTARAARAPYDYVDRRTGEVTTIEKGNLLFTGSSTGDGTPIVRYVKAGPGLYVSHFATCVDRDKHRKR